MCLWFSESNEWDITFISWLKFWVPKTILDQPFDGYHGGPWVSYRRSLRGIPFFFLGVMKQENLVDLVIISHLQGRVSGFRRLWWYPSAPAPSAALAT